MGAFADYPGQILRSSPVFVVFAGNNTFRAWFYAHAHMMHLTQSTAVGQLAAYSNSATTRIVYRKSRLEN